MRARKAPEYSKRWWQRFGFFSIPNNASNQNKSSGIWFHTVSMGEFIAAAPLIQQTLAANPQMLITVTTTTPTGSAQVQKQFAEEIAAGQVFHVYLPYDLPWLLNGFIRKIKPGLLVILETELWPNLIHCAKKSGCKVMVINARLSERSAKGYGKVASLTKSMLRQVDCLAVQNSTDGQRFLQLGMPEQNMQVTGSIKFDLTIDQSLIEQGLQWRKVWGENRKVIVVASTHLGEDQIALSAFKQALDDHPGSLMVVVPRHPERFDQVAKLIEQHGFKLGRRSQDSISEHNEVVLLDTMGELVLFLAASDVCIMGGSFVEKGAHNPLEAAALKVPVLIGPSQFNFALICEQLEKAGGLQTVSEQTLAVTLNQWLGDQVLIDEKGFAAKAVVDNNRGAKQKVFELIESYK
ncbi:MAG: 3-deoxy-D-manno-octulosonic-acid transferase [Bermanella sp.]|jgi:3-deoxy-D-manno-octulosonic-acid transferase